MAELEGLKSVVTHLGIDLVGVADLTSFGLRS